MSKEEIKDGYTRVSEILDPFSKFKYSMIPPEVLANAADRGTRVHDYCNSYANNIFLSHIDEDCEGYVKSFIKWYDDNVEKLISSEERIYNNEYMLTGKYDMIVRLKNDHRNTLIDIKTPVQSSRSWALQLSAYEILIRADSGVPIHRRIVVQLPKSGGKSKQIEYEDHKKDQNLFLSALHLYHHFNPISLAIR